MNFLLQMHPCGIVWSSGVPELFRFIKVYCFQVSFIQPSLKMLKLILLRFHWKNIDEPHDILMYRKIAFKTRGY